MTITRILEATLAIIGSTTIAFAGYSAWTTRND